MLSGSLGGLLNPLVNESLDLVLQGLLAALTDNSVLGGLLDPLVVEVVGHELVGVLVVGDELEFSVALVGEPP